MSEVKSSTSSSKQPQRSQKSSNRSSSKNSSSKSKSSSSKSSQSASRPQSTNRTQSSPSSNRTQSQDAKRAQSPNRTQDTPAPNRSQATGRTQNAARPGSRDSVTISGEAKASEAAASTTQQLQTGLQRNFGNSNSNATSGQVQGVSGQATSNVSAQGPTGGTQPTGASGPSGRGPTGGTQPTGASGPSGQGPTGGTQPTGASGPSGQGPTGGTQPTGASGPSGQTSLSPQLSEAAGAAARQLADKAAETQPSPGSQPTPEAPPAGPPAPTASNPRPYNFRPIPAPRNLPPSLNRPPFVRDGRLHLNEIRPEHINNLSPQERQAFFRALRGQTVSWERPHAETGAPIPWRGDAAFHVTNSLSMQDPTGRTTARIAATNPEIFTDRRHGGPTDHRRLTEEYGRNFDTVVEERLRMHNGRLPAEGSQAIADLSRRYLQDHGRDDPRALNNLVDRAAEGLDRYRGPQGQRANANTIGATVGSIAAGLYTSGFDRSTTASLITGLASDLVGAVPGARLAVAGLKAALRLAGSEGDNLLNGNGTEAQRRARMFQGAWLDGLEQAHEAGNLSADDIGAMDRGFRRAFYHNGEGG